MQRNHSSHYPVAEAPSETFDSSSLFHLPVSHQRKSLFFLLLLAMARAVGAKPIQKNEVHDDFSEICQDTSLQTFNKGSKVRVAVAPDGDMIAYACLPPITNATLCAIKGSELQRARPKLLQELRNGANADFNTWITEINKQGLSYAPTWTPEQKAAYNNIMSTFITLKKRSFFVKHMLAKKGGNCYEHSARALIRILDRSLQYHLDVKVQWVVLTDNDADHVFLLLNSNLNDVTIVNDKKAVRALLEKATGMICDTWNRGNYESIASDISNLYRPRGNHFPWADLEIQTFSLRFSQFDKLHPQGKKMICEALREMGLNVLPGNKCDTLFKKKLAGKVAEKDQVKESSKKFEL